MQSLILQVKETLPEEILSKMHAAPKPDVPIIDAHDLPNADGLMFGFPTRHALLHCCGTLAQPHARACSYTYIAVTCMRATLPDNSKPSVASLVPL